MSLTSLAREQVTRQQGGMQEASRRVARRLRGDEAFAPEVAVELQSLGVGEGKQTSRPSNALEVLTRFIPTETITLYLATCAAMESLEKLLPRLDVQWVAYLGFIVLTPMIFLLVYVGQQIALGLPTPFPPPREWPWFKLIASTIAFAAWALTIPTRPFWNSAEGGAVAALLAIFVSVFLTLIEPICDPQPDD